MTMNSIEQGNECEVRHLLEQAARCRRLASDFLDKQTIEALSGFAENCYRQAAAVLDAHPATDFAAQKCSSCPFWVGEFKRCA